jgi:hypothetical protein
MEEDYLKFKNRNKYIYINFYNLINFYLIINTILNNSNWFYFEVWNYKFKFIFNKLKFNVSNLRK